MYVYWLWLYIKTIITVPLEISVAEQPTTVKRNQTTPDSFSEQGTSEQQIGMVVFVYCVLGMLFKECCNMYIYIYSIVTICVNLSSEVWWCSP